MLFFSSKDRIRVHKITSLLGIINFHFCISIGIFLNFFEGTFQLDWLHRNALAFRGGQPNLIKVFEGAKAHVWFWVKHLGKGLDGYFADWSREPARGCLLGFRGI